MRQTFFQGNVEAPVHSHSERSSWTNAPLLHLFHVVHPPVIAVPCSVGHCLADAHPKIGGNVVRFELNQKPAGRRTVRISDAIPRVVPRKDVRSCSSDRMQNAIEPAR